MASQIDYFTGYFLLKQEILERGQTNLDPSMRRWIWTQQEHS